VRHDDWGVTDRLEFSAEKKKRVVVAKPVRIEDQ